MPTLHPMDGATSRRIPDDSRLSGCDRTRWPGRCRPRSGANVAVARTPGAGIPGRRRVSRRPEMLTHSGIEITLCENWHSRWMPVVENLKAACSVPLDGGPDKEVITRWRS